MGEIITRLQRIKLSNFKNVKTGEIEFSSSKNESYFNKEAELMGLYGQNGSGKTALVDSLSLLKKIVSGKNILGNTYELIKKGALTASLQFDLYIKTQVTEYLLFYEFEIMEQMKETVIVNEALAYKKLINGSWSVKKTIIEWNVNNSDNDILFKPEKNYNLLVAKNSQARIDISVAKTVSNMSNSSFIFHDLTYNVVKENEQFFEYANIIGLLKQYANNSLVVIHNSQSSSINSNTDIMFKYIFCDSKENSTGNISIKLSEPDVISKGQFTIINRLIKQMNIVLNVIVPGMSIKVKDYGSQILEAGEEGNRIELLSSRNGVDIPLRYESDGVSKILSILSSLIAVYNSYGVCLVVDELDAGVFEFLLGELLVIFEKSGKGQLIFTSHNFRPLELLDPKSIVFTTINPQNRYVRFTNIKQNNNLRSVYYRNISLGGQAETLYDETNNYEISHALRKAGEVNEQ